MTRGITLVGEKEIAYDGLNNDKNNWYYDSPSFWDFAIPGYGHLRFGTDKVRYRDALIHAGTTLGAAGLAFHFHNKANSYYYRSIESSSTESAENYLDREQTFQKRSKIMIVTAITSYVIDIVHLVNKNNKQKNLINKVIGAAEINLSNYPAGIGVEYGLSLKF